MFRRYLYGGHYGVLVEKNNPRVTKRCSQAWCTKRVKEFLAIELQKQLNLLESVLYLKYIYIRRYTRYRVITYDGMEHTACKFYVVL